MRWEGLSDFRDALERMAKRVDDATFEAVTRGLEIIQEQARVNTRTFIEWTGRLADSIVTEDPVQVGPGTYRGRVFPSGGESPGTPYGRIQEMGGIITAKGPTGMLWWEGLRADGSFGLIGKPFVTIRPHPYMAPALLESRTALQAEMAGVWGQAIGG